MDGPQKNIPIPKDNEARIGGDMFIQVSNNYPATPAFQAAKIALICREIKLDPRELGRALLLNRTEFNRCFNAAINAHKHRGAEVPDLSKLEMFQTIQENFSLATHLRNVPNHELESFLSTFNRELIDSPHAEIDTLKQFTNQYPSGFDTSFDAHFPELAIDIDDIDLE